MKFGILFYSFFLFLLPSLDHHYHEAVLKINLNSESNKLEITSRTFSHDMVTAINVNEYFVNGELDPEIEKKVDNYLQNRINLLINNNRKNLTLKGPIEQDGYETVAIYSIAFEDKIKTLEVNNRIFVDFLPDHENVVDLLIDNQIYKSKILNKTDTTFTFFPL